MSITVLYAGQIKWHGCILLTSIIMMTKQLSFFYHISQEQILCSGKMKEIHILIVKRNNVHIQLTRKCKLGRQVFQSAYLLHVQQGYTWVYKIRPDSSFILQQSYESQIYLYLRPIG